MASIGQYAHRFLGSLNHTNGGGEATGTFGITRLTSVASGDLWVIQLVCLDSTTVAPTSITGGGTWTLRVDQVHGSRRTFIYTTNWSGSGNPSIVTPSGTWGYQSTWWKPPPNVNTTIVVGGVATGTSPVAPSVSHNASAAGTLLSFMSTGTITGAPTAPTDMENVASITASPATYIRAAYRGLTGSSTGTKTWSGSSGTAMAVNIVLEASAPSGVLLPPLKTISSGGESGTTILQWDRGASTWTAPGSGIGNTGHTRIDEEITSSPVSGDTGIGLNNAANINASTNFGLGSTPSDFASMNALSIRYSTAQVGTYSDDTGRLVVRVRSSAGLQLAAFGNTGSADSLLLDFFNGSDWTATTSALFGGGSGTAPAYNKALSFVYVNTAATKAQWDGALIEFVWLDTRNMGSDAAAIVLVDFQLEGTYTASGPPPATTVTPVKSTSASSSDVANVIPIHLPTTVTPVKSTSASSSDTAQVTVSNLPTTVTPVKSTSTSSSDVANVTATYLPTTVTPVKSTSASSSDTANVTATYLPTTVTPVKSTSASSSDVAQISAHAASTTVNGVKATSASSATVAQITVKTKNLFLGDNRLLLIKKGDVDIPKAYLGDVLVFDSGANLWTPIELTSLELWLPVMTDPSYISVSGTDVQVIGDKSGNGRDYSADGSPYADYGGGFRTINSMDVLDISFVAVALSPVVAWGVPQPITICAVVQPDDTDINAALLGGTGFYVGQGAAGTGTWRIVAPNTTQQWNDPGPTTAPQVITWIVNGSSSIVRVNGVDNGSGILSPGINALPTDHNLFSNAAQGSAMNCGLGEMIICSSVVSGAELTALENYMMNLAGL